MVGLYGQVDVGQVRASDRAQQFLRSLIFSGCFGPQDRLPSERELAAHLGISRITLREALKSLEAAGYLVTTVGANGGTKVSDVDALSRCWGRWAHEHYGELEGLFEFQLAVETAQASLAALKRTAEDLKSLETPHPPACKDFRLLQRWHVAFHTSLAKAAHNEYLERAMAEIRSQLFLPVQEALRAKGWDTITAVHDDILSAVRDQDAARAAEAMRLHLEYTQEHLLEVFTSR